MSRTGEVNVLSAKSTKDDQKRQTKKSVRKHEPLQSRSFCRSPNVESLVSFL